MAFNNAVDATQTGFQSITSAGQWNGRTLIAGAGVSITNGDGTAGNPVISATGGAGTAWQVITTVVLANQPTVVFNDPSISTYNELLILVDTVVPTQFNAINLNLSTDAGATYTVTCTRFDGQYTVAGSSSTNTTPVIYPSTSLNTIQGYLHFINNTAATLPKAIAYAMMNTSGVQGNNSAGWMTTAAVAQLTGIRINHNAGNLVSGTITLLGR